MFKNINTTYYLAIYPSLINYLYYIHIVVGNIMYLNYAYSKLVVQFHRSISQNLGCECIILIMYLNLIRIL